MSYFGQSVENESLNTLVPIERFYPDLAPNTVSNATSESSSEPLFQGTRILYWYHPDYVSNVDLVTDVNGEAFELFLYNAWGESLHHWISNSSNSWSSPYRFNSKELDPETGMHYYGARYHHPKLSVWMSVDPLAHENLNQYQFTGNSPISFIDPDGRDSIFYDHYGTEINRVAMEGEDLHFLKHDDGNHTIGGETYYQGLSRESFFGDRTGSGELFEGVDDRFDYNGEWKTYALVRDYIDPEHTVGDFIRESKSEQYYDYKIHVLGMKDNPNQAFLYNGVLVNVNEMGNILWGATAAKFGFTSFWAQSGAYAFTLWDEGKEDEYGEQRAIEIGVYNWNNQTKEEQ
jgi:RHS repeat-associated protein